MVGILNLLIYLKAKKNKNELFMVIIYEKQIYYSFTIAVAGVTFGVLLLLAVGQEIRIRRKKEN